MKARHRGVQMANLQVVEHFEDIRVQIVDSQSQADLLVYVTKSETEAKGKDEIWCFVKHFPNCKIRFVTSNPDLKVLYVDRRSQAKWKKPHKLMKQIA
jgi:ribonucleotide monophosphatase NagD (HAD superfamily)